MLDTASLVIPFIHLLAGICFVGVHIGIRFHSGFYFSNNETEIACKIKYLKKQLNILIVLVLILALSAWYIMDYNINDPIFSTLASIQWFLYAFVILNLVYIYTQFKKCENVQENKLLIYNEKLTLIIYYFIPLNILISFIGIFFALSISSII